MQGTLKRLAFEQIKQTSEEYDYVKSPTDSESSIVVVSSNWQEQDSRNQVICCICGMRKNGGIRPVFRKSEVQKFVCLHDYCKECFNGMVVVNFAKQDCEWDGYAMVASFYRFKHNNKVVFSCQLCKME
jgi:hypothetical protein